VQPGHALKPPAADALLLEWLLIALAPMNRTRVKQLLRSGRVTVNGASATRHDHPLRAGDAVFVARDAPPPAAQDVRIVYEDSALIVLDKPAGLLTVATEKEKLDTAFVRLNEHLAARAAGRAFVVHRLDRETSGLLLFARDADTRDALQADWDSVEKTYLAVIEGAPRIAEGRIENFLIEGRDLRVRASARPGPDAKRAVSAYRVLASRDGYSLVEVRIETGRKHQIRVHMAGLGCPLAGDRAYGARTDPARRVCLHATKLAFDHPNTGARVEVESELPSELARLVSM
jgi:23S rRNA pseudouridine1911/1915/1917 synthase